MFWYRYGTGPSKESCFKPTKIGQGNFNDILIDVTKGNVVRVDSNSWKSASSASPPKNWTFSTGMEPVEPFTLWEQLQSWTFAKIGAPSTVVLVVQVLVAGDELPGNRCWISPLFPEKKKNKTLSQATTLWKPFTWYNPVPLHSPISKCWFFIPTIKNMLHRQYHHHSIPPKKMCEVGVLFRFFIPVHSCSPLKFPTSILSLLPTWRIIPVSKWLGSPPFYKPWSSVLLHLEGVRTQPQPDFLGDLQYDHHGY